MDLQGRSRWLARGATKRLRDAWWPIVLASLAAALSWFVAHNVLGHPQPFFAPIAAAIALSTSQIQRFRRIVQMVIGVLLGIGIGEALVVALGTSSAALGVITLVTLGAAVAAVAAGVGFFGEGMMFANQAAASAIVVVTLHRHGTGGERVIDAIVGGAVALLLGVVMFPADPLSMFRGAERSVLRTAATPIHGTTPITRDLASQVSALAGAIERLAATAGAWPEDLRAEVQRLAVRTLDHPATPPTERDAVAAAIIRAAADDLARVVVGGAAEWTAPDDRGAWHG